VHIEGILLGDLSIKGPFNSPSFQGPLLLKHGRMDIPATSQVIDNVEMSGRLEGRTIIVDSIHAQDERDGLVDGKGLLTIDESGHFSWQADLSCHEMEIISLPYAKTSAGGNVRLCGDSSSLQITGEAISNNAIVDLAARFPEAIPEMNISYKDEAPPLKNPYIVTLNLGVDGQNGLTIRGKGLSSIWKGTARITGNASSLQMKGMLRCAKGSFMLGSRELHITEGTISVHGNLFTDSQLHIVATINLPSVDASVCLSGSLASPKLSLQSTPMKPENEILSLILFNKEYGDISPLESLQLAQTALRIRQTKSPLDFIEKMKESLGLDVLDVNSSTPQSSGSTTLALDPSDTGSLSSQPQNDVSLRVGKYISQGVAVVVSKDVTSDTNRLGIEAHVAGNVTAAAEIGDDETSVVSLRWKKDY
jgi:translocation and assembly module TamB